MTEKEPPLERLNRLIALFNEGRYGEVEVVARALVEEFPTSGFAWLILGVSLQTRGEDALTALQEAAKLLPGDAEAHRNLGVALEKRGLLEEAEGSFRRAVRINPLDAEAHLSLGRILKDAGEFDQAEASIRAVLHLRPGHAKAHSLLGELFTGLGQIGLAKQHFRQAVALDPDDAHFHFSLGLTEQHLGHLEGACDQYCLALQIDPNLTMAHFNMGVALQGLGRGEEAILEYQQALELDPTFTDALNNLAVVYRALGRSEKAIESYLATLAIDPDNFQANLLLVSIYMEQKRLVDAEAVCRKALEAKPDFAEMHQNLARVLAYLSDYRDVVKESNIAFAIKPDHDVMWEQRLYAFSYHPDLSAEEIFKEFVRWGDRFPEPKVDFTSHDCNPHRRLRIGYVSPDFRSHSSRFYFWPLFANHNREAFELFAYSNVEKEVAWTRIFQGQFEHWRDIRNVSDEAAARMIREDGIDILVDLCSHMQANRLGVFTLKSAPIQVTWLGAAWTTGLKTIDYVLFDPFLAPAGTLARESIVRLPHSFLAYRPPEETADIAPAPCLKNGYITFGYTGRTERLNHRTFRVWGEILKRLPDAKLILDYGPFADPKTQTYYRSFLAQHGVDVSRVILKRSANIFEGLNDVDILLDSFPHSGGTMLMDAFWMGVPALTLASRPPLGRLGASMLMNLQLPEWIAPTEAEYIEKACEFAEHPQALNELRLGLRERMKHSPLMDGPGFARGVEAAYHDMFKTWLAGPKPEEISSLYHLFHAGKLAEAEIRAKAFTQQFPAAGVCWKVLGVSLLMQGKDAIPTLLKASDLLPLDAVVHYNLGVALQKIDERGAAEASYRKALAIDPDNARTQNNLFLVLIGQSRLVEAEAFCRQALERNPDHAQMHQNLAISLAYLSDFREVLVQSDEALRLHFDSPQIWEQRLYALSYHPDLSAEAIFAEFTRWGDRFPEPKPEPKVVFAVHDLTLHRRLRVGYVSPDFRRHTSRFFFQPLFFNHNLEAVELFAYSNVQFEDEFTDQFKARFHHWRDIRGVDDGAVAELIRKDGIDILVDCCNHMHDHRLGVFALKPAPIQVTWLGAAWTTGLKTVDYVLFDRFLAPEGTLARESILRLPHSFIAFQPPEQTADIQPAPCLKNGYITFGYTGRTERLNHRTFTVWGEILKRLPDARLILDFGPFADPKTQAYYRAFLTQHGVDTSRVILRKSTHIFQGLNDIDILLDSFPHSGGTMLMDAFWMGVPALTLASRPPLGRLCVTMLMNLNLPEWVATTEEEYIDKARGFASQPQTLNALRLGMRERMQDSSLMDGPGFASEVEAAYRSMFEHWVKGGSQNGADQGGCRRTGEGS